MIDLLSASNLSALPSIRHGFFTRKGGVSDGGFDSLNCSFAAGDDVAKVIANRTLVAQHMGLLPKNLVTLKQVHGEEVVNVENVWDFEDAPEADAMVTKESGLALGILTADCVPVLFADPQMGVIGAAHAGWRSAFAGVLENTVEAMQRLGAERAFIQAAIGPCIWQDSYEVDQEFMDRFLEADFQNNRFFCEGETEGHFLFELPAYVRDRLNKMELGGVSLSPADTFADEDRFFSFRRSTLRGEAQSGRQISVIAQV